MGDLKAKNIINTMCVKSSCGLECVSPIEAPQHLTSARMPASLRERTEGKVSPCFPGMWVEVCSRTVLVLESPYRLLRHSLEKKICVPIEGVRREDVILFLDGNEKSLPVMGSRT